MEKIWSTLSALLTGGIGLWLIQRASRWWNDRNITKRKENEVMLKVIGLPCEMKAVLAKYQLHRSHTLKGNPTDPPTRQLIHMGLLIPGEGGGTYDVVNRYLTLSPVITNFVLNLPA